MSVKRPDAVDVIGDGVANAGDRAHAGLYLYSVFVLGYCEESAAGVYYGVEADVRVSRAHG